MEYTNVNVDQDKSSEKKNVQLNYLTANEIPAHVKLTKIGLPDMRYTSDPFIMKLKIDQMRKKTY